MNEKIFDDFSAVCARFADAVKEKRYDKINYDVWRYWRGTKNQVKVSFCTGSVKNITITDQYKMDIFSTSDNSFGEFLYNEYFNEEGTKTMVSGHTITDKKIEELAKEVANLKNEKLAELAVSAADKVESIAINKLDGGSIFEGRLAPSTAYINDYAIATVADVATKASVNDVTALASRVDELENMYKEKIEHNKEKKEMKNFNFDFGKVMDSQARVSMYGIAVKSPSGTWVAYDKKAEQMMDVDILNFEGMDMLYKMPVALNQVAAGDVIIHMGKPCFVVSFNEEGKSFNVIDIFNAEEKCILPVRSPFGFNFVTKLVSLIDFTGSASADQPFGNMLPFLMMKDGNMDDMLPFLMMSQGGDFASNPMMMMLLMDKGGDKSEIFKMMAMAQMFSQNK